MSSRVSEEADEGMAAQSGRALDAGPLPPDAWAGASLVGRGLAAWLLLIGLWSTGGTGGGERARCDSPRPALTREAAISVIRCGGADRHEALSGPVRLLFGATLDVNREDAAALQVLPGIGPGRAAAIIGTRAVRRFERLEDLARVPGIGPRTVARLRGWAHADPSGE
jgi:hypothetical protein